MKKKILFVVTFFSIVSACTKKENTINFTFLQLNDVYEIAPLSGGEIGGMARVETLHKQLVKENPNTFMFLAGDFLNPSLLGTLIYKEKKIKGKQMVEVMNAMNFSLVAFGNHEFDLTEHELQERFNQSTFQWIQTNAMHKTSEGLKPFETVTNNRHTFIPKTVQFTVKNKQGDSIKIGFFSATINSNPKEHVEYGDFYQSAQYAYNNLKAKANFIFGLTHIAIENDKMIANMLPEVPLIMGGHEHVNMSISVGKGKITKADANAKTVWVHRFVYNIKTKQLVVNSELIPITPAIKEDITIKKIVEKWNLLLNEKLQEILPDPEAVIYISKVPLDGRDTQVRSEQTSLGKLITKGMAFSLDNKVDCALVNGGSIRLDDELQGGITGVDIFRVLPFGGEVIKVEMTGNLLKKVLTYGRLKSGKGAYLQRYNISFNEKNKEWSVNSKPISDEQIYTVAVSDYLLKGYDIPFLKTTSPGILKIYQNKPTDKAFDIRIAIISYLKSLKN